MVAPTAQAAGPNTTITFKTVLSPSTKITSTIGDTVYGLMLFTGEGTWMGETIKVERRLNFKYTNGDGPAGGFATLIWPDGSQIAMETSGFTNAGTTFSGVGRQNCTRKGGVEANSYCTYTVKLHKG